MARFSIETAIGEGFSLIKRRPWSVFVWGLLMVVPYAASMSITLPMMGSMIADLPLAMSGEGTPDPALSGLMQFQGVAGLLNLLQLFVTVIVYTAIMRAVVRPRERWFFSLRLGMDELRVAVVGFAVFVGLYVAILVMALLGIGIGFAIWGLGTPTNWIVIAVMVVVVILATWLGMARVSLFVPASVLYRSFAFSEGWRLGRGRTGALFGMMLLTLLMILVIEAVAFGIGVAIVVGFAGATSGMDWSRLPSTMDGNPFEGLNAMITAHWPWFAVGGVLAAMLFGVILTLAIAPFASACRQLATSETPSPADDHSPASAG